VYLVFTDGYAPSVGELFVNAELCAEAIRLARLLVGLLPRDGEARGPLASMTIHHARRAARSDEHGDIVALDEQDRSRWDRAAIDEGTRELEDALHRKGTGPYRIQAAIAALHASASTADATDWPQIASLYEELIAREPSAPARVNWCIALGMALGPDRGLEELERLAEDGSLDGSDRVCAARADLLRRAGRIDEARFAYDEAIAQARNAKERRFLERRAAQ
jgi:RNA polymerase sigma-70 factor, ECF subfamily